MLIKQKILEGIEKGEIQLAFRRWKRPTVRSGGRLRTRIGELAIEAVDRVTFKSITEKEAHQAGFSSRDELVAELRARAGALYRIRLSLAGEDARIALRNASKLSKAELAAVAARLERMDTRSSDGPWTVTYLGIIARSPATLAAELAASCGVAKAPFKARVRRLKELGLTESLEKGYRLSPRGRAVWKHVGRAR